MNYDDYKLASPDIFSYCNYCEELIEDDEIMCEQCREEQKADFNED